MSTITSISIDLETIKVTVKQIAADAVYREDRLDIRIRRALGIVGYDNVGVYRTVAIRDNVAYKILHDLHCQHNKREWDLYHNVSDAARAMMAEPYYISECGRVIAMEGMAKILREDAAGTSFSYPPLIAFNEKLRVQLEKCYDRDKVSHLMSDNHAGNIGIGFDGMMKWIDYASE
jgi:hypothetical protein